MAYLSADKKTKSEVVAKAAKIGADFPEELDTKLALLEKLIAVFTASKKCGERTLRESVLRVKNEFLIERLGCTEEVANTWIKQALERS